MPLTFHWSGCPTPAAAFISERLFSIMSHQFSYPDASVVQMRFLRLHSVTAVQRVTYSCHPGSRQGPTERSVKFLTDTRRQSYLGALRDCMVRIHQRQRKDISFLFLKYVNSCLKRRGRCCVFFMFV